MLPYGKKGFATVLLAVRIIIILKPFTQKDIYRKYQKIIKFK